VAGDVGIAFGYLLGSVLPAYIAGRIHGIDLRRVGTGNPGSTNAWHVLGWRVGLGVLLLDLIKGLVAMGVAHMLGAGTPWIYAAGIAAVVGHRLPFYLGFRGGEGVGTSVGLLLFALGTALAGGTFSPQTLLALAVGVAVIFLLFRRGPVVAVFVLPVLLALLLLGSKDAAFDWFVALPVANIWLVNVAAVRHEHLVAAAPGWRAMLRALDERDGRR
jgi:glycerol-3-phosphate acyltransferase PlsY